MMLDPEYYLNPPEGLPTNAKADIVDTIIVPVRVEDGEAEFANEDWAPDYEDYEYGITVASAEDIIDAVFDSLWDATYGLPDGEYLLKTTLYINYRVWGIHWKN